MKRNDDFLDALERDLIAGLAVEFSRDSDGKVDPVLAESMAGAVNGTDADSVWSLDSALGMAGVDEDDSDGRDSFFGDDDDDRDGDDDDF